MKRLVTTVALTAAIAAGLGLAATGAADAQEKTYKFLMVNHGSTQFPFIAKQAAGMRDACELLGAECQFMEVTDIGNVDQELRNLERAILLQPDGIAVSILDDTAFDEPIQRALDAGIPVIAYTLDDTEGAAGNPRMAFIGQTMPAAGYALGEALAEFFPAEGDVQVLIGIQDYSQAWATQRGAGVRQYLEDWDAAHADRAMTIDEIETGIDAGVIASRVGAYVQKNPETTAYVDVGFFHASAAVGLRDLGYAPGDVLLAGFDMVQMVFDEMKTGYIQVSIDQQGYLQGFMPIMQLYLIALTHGSGWDIDSGKALFYPDDVPALEPLVQAGLR